MRLRIGVFAIACIFTISATAKAQKWAYVNMARAMNAVDDGKAAKARLKEMFAAKQRKLTQQQENLKQRKADLEASRLGTEQRQAELADIRAEFKLLEQAYHDYQQQLLEEEERATADIVNRLRVVVRDIGDRDGYDTIVDTGDLVQYGTKTLDITDQVIKEYNRNHSAVSPAPHGTTATAEPRAGESQSGEPASRQPQPGTAEKERAVGPTRVALVTPATFVVATLLPIRVSKDVAKLVTRLLLSHLSAVSGARALGDADIEALLNVEKKSDQSDQTPGGLGGFNGGNPMRPPVSP